MPISDAVTALDRDLRDIFGDRLRSVVAYATVDRLPNTPQPPLVVVAALTPADLRACAGRVAVWHDSGLATPLMLESPEFARSLDAFPFEFGAIIARHAVAAGLSPFEGLSVSLEDLRRACEVQARSHLLHLREGYLEAGGDPAAIHELVARSAPPLMALLTNLARIDGASAESPGALAAFAERAIGPAPALGEVLGLAGRRSPAVDAARTYPAYLDAAERLVAYVDRWSAS